MNIEDVKHIKITIKSKRMYIRDPDIYGRDLDNITVVNDPPVIEFTGADGIHSQVVPGIALTLNAEHKSED